MNPYEFPDEKEKQVDQPYLPPEELPLPVMKDDSMWIGVGQYCLIAALCLLTFIIPSVGLFFWAAIGVSQLLFVIPMIIVYVSNKQMQSLKGLLIMAGIVFLLNGGCWVWVASSMGNMH